ncbi:class I SAM-dependent methyltransferase [Candidatus Bathyarchaeota archaeon]|nr:class I SAM-dependent methyltransferase [Candidatus Bathyarchaeota archaeon]
MFNLRDKIVADVGSGTGLSTFDLAKYARHVVGIEPEDSMRNLAVKNAEKRHIENVARAQNFLIRSSRELVRVRILWWWVYAQILVGLPVP